MNKKLLVSDLDGTLLVKNHKIDNFSKYQIQEFCSNPNNLFIMATGRIDDDIKYVESNINIKCEYRISLNGAVIVDKNDEVIYREAIDKSLLNSLKEYLFGLNIYMEIFDHNRIYATEKDYSRPTTEFKDTYFSYDANIKAEVGSSVFPIKFVLYIKDEAKILQIKEYIKNNFPSLSALMTGSISLEVFNNTISKGKAIDIITEKLNVKKEDIYVVGDNENDISMFERFSKSFAMNKSKNNVKIFANNIALKVGEVIDYIENRDKYNLANNILGIIPTSLGNFEKLHSYKKYVNSIYLNDTTKSSNLDSFENKILYMENTFSSPQELANYINTLNINNEVISLSAKKNFFSTANFFEFKNYINKNVLLMISANSVDEALELDDMGFNFVILEGSHKGLDVSKFNNRFFLKVNNINDINLHLIDNNLRGYIL